MTKQKGNYYSMIAATIHVSETEIAALYPDYQYSWYENDKEKLAGILYEFGIDTSQYWEYQEPVQHRNRMNQLVTSGRYYGNERLDEAWLNSGLASEAAKDKAKNSRLLDDLYREKALTIDTQMALERRDLFASTTEDENEEW